MLNLDSYQTNIETREPGILPDSKLLKIGSFSNHVDHDKMIMLGNIPHEIEHQIEFLVHHDEWMNWAVQESHGGLFVYTERHPDPATFRLIMSVEMYVYLPEDIFTFCQLKFSENLTKLNN